MSYNFIAHVELPVLDLDRTAAFLNDLFGWDFKAFGNGYYLYNKHKGTMVGLRRVATIHRGDTPVFHVLVDDIDAMLEKVPSLGGEVVRGKTVIPVYGWYAVINDVNGNHIGLYQAPSNQ